MVCFDVILDFSLSLLMHFQFCASNILIGHLFGKKIRWKELRKLNKDRIQVGTSTLDLYQRRKIEEKTSI
jgi:hypothetical protein